MRAAIGAANADSAKGHIDQNGQRYEVLSNDRPARPPIIATWSSPTAATRRYCCTTSATSSRFQREHRNAGLYNNQPTVGVIVYPLPGANIIRTVAQIKKVLPAVEATLPPNIQVHIAWTARNRSPPRSATPSAA